MVHFGLGTRLSSAKMDFYVNEGNSGLKFLASPLIQERKLCVQM